MRILRDIAVLVVLNGEPGRADATVGEITALCGHVGGCTLVHVTSLEHALRVIQEEPFHVLVAGDNLPDGSALNLVALVRSEHPRTVVVASSPDRKMREQLTARQCRTTDTCEGMVPELRHVLDQIITPQRFPRN